MKAALLLEQLLSKVQDPELALAIRSLYRDAYTEGYNDGKQDCEDGTEPWDGEDE